MRGNPHMGARKESGKPHPGHHGTAHDGASALRSVTGHGLQGPGLQQAQNLAGAGNQSMLAQLAQYTGKRLRGNAQLGGNQALALVQGDQPPPALILLGVGWDMVKDIFKSWLKHRFGRPKLNKLKHIAIDEISIRKGHTYVT